MLKSINATSLTKCRIIDKVLHKVREIMPEYFHGEFNGLKIDVTDQRPINSIFNWYPYFNGDTIKLDVHIDKTNEFDFKEWGRYKLYQKLPNRPEMQIKWDKGKEEQEAVDFTLSNTYMIAGEGEIEFRLVCFLPLEENNYQKGISLFHTKTFSKDRIYIWAAATIGGGVIGWLLKSVLP